MLAMDMPVIIFCVALAIVGTCAVYPLALRFAIKHQIVDKPSARKLQPYPIPVFGGVAIALGMVIPTVLAAMRLPYWNVSMYVLLFVGLMLLTGVADDLCDLSAWARFLIEMAVVALYIWLGQSSIDSLHGLWGCEKLPVWISIPLSIIAGVGIINSINLIDGVDGYSSGFCMAACVVFSMLSFYVGEYALGCLLLICTGSTIPFFIHNVFGRKTKMYIGDGGTLMLGSIMVVCVFRVLTYGSAFEILQTKGIGLVALCLAVLCIPVFDTVRVMCERIWRGVSPFTPDKTHLHHLLLQLGCSHKKTMMSLIGANTFIVFCWWLSYRFGASQEGQLYVVTALGVLSTFGFYGIATILSKKKSNHNHT